MSASQTILGLTPITMRLAYEYVKRGLGTHEIDHPFYDRVVVREVAEFQRLAAGVPGVQYGAVLQVAFYRNGQRVRWIDWCVLPSGGGGEPAISLVHPLNETASE